MQPKALRMGTAYQLHHFTHTNEKSGGHTQGVLLISSDQWLKRFNDVILNAPYKVFFTSQMHSCSTYNHKLQIDDK